MTDYRGVCKHGSSWDCRFCQEEYAKENDKAYEAFCAGVEAAGMTWPENELRRAFRLWWDSGSTKSTGGK